MDANEIKKVIQIYLDGCYAADGGAMADVFHDVAHVYAPGEDGTLVEWDKKAFVALVDGQDGGAVAGWPRYDEILSIDFTGENTAVARAKVRVSDMIYTDILCFMRLDGKWGVISKVFEGVPATA
jgi:hypothetical protein